MRGILRSASGHEPQVSCTGLKQLKKSPQGCDMVQDVASYSVHDIVSLQYLRCMVCSFWICTYLYDTVSYKLGAKDGHYIIYTLHRLYSVQRLCNLCVKRERGRERQIERQREGKESRARRIE
jgi:hypothetical protein